MTGRNGRAIRSVAGGGAPRVIDVAARAGVSVKTASRVLNGHTSVSRATADRVRRAAGELGYHVGPRAPGRLPVPPAIGMVVGDLTDPFHAAAVVGAARLLRAHGTELVTITRDAPEEESPAVLALLDRRIRALLVMPSAGSQGYLQGALPDGVPVVFLDRPPHGVDGDCVLVQNAAGSRRATEQLLEHGHRRIAVLADTSDAWTARQRLDGAVDALVAARADSLDLVRAGLGRPQAAAAEAVRMLEQADPPTAFLCLNSRVCLGVLTALHRRARRGPAPAVIGFDDFDTAELLGITVVRQDPEELGRAAVELALRRTADPDHPPRRIVLPVHLVRRGSGERVPPGVRAAVATTREDRMPETEQGTTTTGAAGPGDEVGRLLDGARAAVLPEGGFGWLDAQGRPDPARPRELWITCRMTHCLSLGTLLGRADGGYADHGVTALRTVFRDPEHGGWYASLGPDGPLDTTKAAYGHAFVLLASSSATAAGRPGAAELLEEACGVVLERFWDEEVGVSRESWDRAWTTEEAYRGANANMHSVEAFLAVGSVTGEREWYRRALRIAGRMVDSGARAHGWRLPEHLDLDLEPVPDYNADRPDDPFRPFGATPGHGLEWARLLLGLRTALLDGGDPAPGWLLPAAVALFDRALADGWYGRRGGFVYTTDWEGRPVVREQFHWVLCEAMAAAVTLHAATGDARYVEHFDRFWEHARATFLDGGPGWRHEAAPDGGPSERTWSGRPDVYHALQAVLSPTLPSAPSFAAALRDGHRYPAATFPAR